MIVIDCSALIFFLTDDGSIGHRIRERLARDDVVAAPHLLDYEVMSALFGLARGRRGAEPKLSGRALRRAVLTFQEMPVDRYPTISLWERLRQLSANLSAYDANYVALAETLGVPLVTSDLKIEASGVVRCAIEGFSANG